MSQGLAATLAACDAGFSCCCCCCCCCRYTSSNNIASSWSSSAYSDSAWALGRTRFGYGAGLAWNTSLPGTSTALHHYFRTRFCLSDARWTWLRQQQLQLKVMADNGADVYVNGVRLLADAASNHDPKYWNNIVAVPGSSPFQAGEAARLRGGLAAGLGCATQSAHASVTDAVTQPPPSSLLLQRDQAAVEPRLPHVPSGIRGSAELEQVPLVT